MKVSKEMMAEHKEQIIVAGARRFRERGFEGIGVADIMNDVGLTHGGFYRHFASKEDLIVSAVRRALSDTLVKWGKITEDAPGDRLEALVNFYFSKQQYDRPETGCLLAALGGELSRQPSAVKDAVTDGNRRIIDFLSGIAPGKTKALRRKQAVFALASMVGGMILARGISDRELGQEILRDVASAIPHGIRATP